jgi:acyl dehydratase
MSARVRTSGRGNPKVSASELSVGSKREALLVEDLSRTQIVQYAGASGDFNPIHHDETFATGQAGYPSVFAHGMLTMGLTGRLLTDWLGDGVLEDFGVRFVSQVWPGDSLTAVATIESIQPMEGVEGAENAEAFADVSIGIETRNQRDETVVKGSARALLPADR